MSASEVTSTSEDWYSKSTATSSTAGTDDLDKDSFMTLLIAQMTNQDPLEPTTNEDFIAQMAQFQALEEQRTMTDSVESMQETMASLQESNQELLNQLIQVSDNTALIYAIEGLRMESHVASATSMIGKYVLGTTTEGTDVVGKVKSVLIDNSVPYIVLEDGEQIPLMNISKVDTEEIELPEETEEDTDTDDGTTET